MKSTIIPAQITSVEDRIAGNLSFSQILLLLAALFIATAIYILFPTPFKLNLYKFPLVFVLSGLTMTLAIRIKGKVLFQWISIIATYKLRPKRYAFNKNDMLYRAIIHEEKLRKTTAPASKKQKAQSNKASVAETISLENILRNPSKNVRFAFSKRGGIHVSVSEQ